MDSVKSTEAGEGKSKKKYPSHLSNLSYYFTEYCDNTSIHGWKFLGEKGRYLAEKIWWAIFILVSFYFCLNLIISTYNKWMSAPVIVSLATSETPVWKIPFPAVTVCPMIKSVKAKFDFTDIQKWRENNIEYNEHDARKFKYMSLVCPSTLQTLADGNSTDTVDDGVINFLMEVQPSFDNTTHLCKWVGEDCTNSIDEYFSPILTSLGVCYSLNMLDREEMFTKDADVDYYSNFSINHQPPSQWTLEHGYFKGAAFDAYPRRTVLSGPSGGLDLVFYTDGKNIDYSCGDSVQGYKVLLHHPAQMPRANQRYFWVPLNQQISASVKPSMMSTSEELRRYSPKDRKCYFTKEKALKYFKVYNQQNCLFECLTNYTYQTCECVGFFMPRHNSTPVCGSAMRACMKQVNIDFLAREAIFQMRSAKKGKSGLKSGKTKRTHCDCLPSCHSLDYDVEISQLDWDWRKGNILGAQYDNRSSHLSRLRVFFKDLQFMTSERNELYGQTEFWANCGGLLGLFTGFSFISIVEILYFATLRFACNVRKFGRHYWSGANELLENKEEGRSLVV